MYDPDVGSEEELAIKNVLRSHDWSIGSGIGQVKDFENNFKNYIHCKNCVAVNSGTAALHLALSLFNLKNNEVIIPSLSYVSLAHSVIYNDAKPVFVDVDEKSLCIDPYVLKKSITKKTKAIVPVHFGGYSCDLNTIKEIVDDFNLELIEDAALAMGSMYKNQKIGSRNIACFSFHPVKNLAMPKGGAIAINGKSSSKFTKLLKARRCCGVSQKNHNHESVNQLGRNYYMDEFSAAIGLIQLRKLDHIITKKQKTAKRYFDELHIENKMPFTKNCSYNFYWVLTSNRNTLIKKLKERNIEAGWYHTPIHKLEFYKGKTKLPITESISSRLVCLPCHSNLLDSDIDKIVKLINTYT